MVASHRPPTGDLVHNPGMCPDWESNQQPFGLQAGAQSTEPHQPGEPMFLTAGRRMRKLFGHREDIASSASKDQDKRGHWLGDKPGAVESNLEHSPP